MNEPAVLVLEDGRVFHGESFGAGGSTEGEVVFSTSMTGYQEMCTDPSYHGQILCLTYPIIGNYGVSERHEQSARPWVSGLVVRDYSRHPSHWGSEGSLADYLSAHGVTGITGVDTRALTRHIRSHGSRRGIIAPAGRGVQLNAPTLEALVERARAARLPADLEGVAEVSGKGRLSLSMGVSSTSASLNGRSKHRVVVIDCGLKANIVRNLASRPIEPIVVPYSATAEEVLALAPDGVITSPGPGDPEDAETPVRTVRAVLDRGVPFFGICLGHQVLGLAIGAKTSKLKFGHHGGNHPVKEVESGRVYVTSQNHSYQVDADSVPRNQGWRVSHHNVNDGSVEGLVHVEKLAFSVQYHPEGSPGPEDNEYLFDTFLAMVQAHARRDS